MMLIPSVLFWLLLARAKYDEEIYWPETITYITIWVIALIVSLFSPILSYGYVIVSIVLAIILMFRTGIFAKT